MDFHGKWQDNFSFHQIFDFLLQGTQKLLRWNVYNLLEERYDITEAREDVLEACQKVPLRMEGVGA